MLDGGLYKALNGTMIKNIPTIVGLSLGQQEFSSMPTVETDILIFLSYLIFLSSFRKQGTQLN